MWKIVATYKIEKGLVELIEPCYFAKFLSLPLPHHNLAYQHPLVDYACRAACPETIISDF